MTTLFPHSAVSRFANAGSAPSLLPWAESHGGSGRASFRRARLPGKRTSRCGLPSSDSSALRIVRPKLLWPGSEKETARVPPILDSPLSAAPETFLSRDAVYSFPLKVRPAANSPGDRDRPYVDRDARNRGQRKHQLQPTPSPLPGSLLLFPDNRLAAQVSGDINLFARRPVGDRHLRAAALFAVAVAVHVGDRLTVRAPQRDRTHASTLLPCHQPISIPQTIRKMSPSHLTETAFPPRARRQTSRLRIWPTPTDRKDRKRRRWLRLWRRGSCRSHHFWHAPAGAFALLAVMLCATFRAFTVTRASAILAISEIVESFRAEFHCVAELFLFLRKERQQKFVRGYLPSITKYKRALGQFLPCATRRPVLHLPAFAAFGSTFAGTPYVTRAPSARRRSSKAARVARKSCFAISALSSSPQISQLPLMPAAPSFPGA